MSTAGYLRFPTLQGDTLVFVCDDDLWRVDAGGGIAHRLTAGLGEPTHPALSPDGRWIAYVGRDEQHPEVYVMPADGGSARRMTWLGPDVQVRGWTPEGRVLFVTTHGQPFFRNYRAHTLGLDDSLPTVLPFGQVNHLAYGPLRSGTGQHALVIGRNTADPARWKRYRGGTAGHLWIDGDGTRTFRRMTELAGNLTCPMWLGDRVWFLSDREGTGNLYSCRPDGNDLRRHTDHDGFYARHASTDGRRIVYQCGAAIWLFDPQADTAAPVEIRVPGHRTQAARRFVDPAEFLQGFAVHPAGHSVALEVRGKPFTMALWEGAVRQHGVADGVRYRLPQWLADGRTLVAVSDEAGEETLVTFPPEAPAQAVQAPGEGIGRVLALAAAPVGRRVALANHRNEVLLADLDTGICRVVDRSAAGRTESVAWSPDGAWLAYPQWLNPRQCAIRLYDVAGGVAHTVTEPVLRDYAPAFDPEGRYLYFLSVRTFDPVYDEVHFELSFPRAARPYLVALRSDLPPPFEPPPRGMGEPDEAESHTRKGDGAAPGADGGAAAPPAMRVDLDDIAHRVAPFPVPEGRYARIAGLRGKVAWLAQPIVGAHGSGGHGDDKGALEVFDFATGKAEVREPEVDDVALSADAATMVVRSGRRLRALAPAAKPEREGGGNGRNDPPSRRSGWLDLGRLRVSVDPRAEWRQMLREVWRLQRDQFWVPDMSGVDWPAMLRRYAPLVERVATRAELSDLIWELQGELGTSHAYEMGGDHRKPPRWGLGHLAAELADTGDGYEIVAIVRGDPWEPAADSPLNAVGVQARPGERIVAVNGQPVGRTRPPQALLVNQAGCKVELTLAPPLGAAGAPRTVLVRTLSDEVPALYRQWVEYNRRWVHQKSGGRVGYFHLPDMQAAGYAEFHRYFAAEADRGGLIVDIRYNRGGHVSQLLLEKLARRRVGYDLSRWSLPQPYPAEAPFGPVVALTNEHAGSDGDIFSHCFKLMQLGPLVGHRTWGGVIGIWPRHGLVDGSETTQPEFSFWFRDVGFQVENHGTDPTLEIDNAPHDLIAGRDRQLETALDVALGLLDGAGPLMPEFGQRPVLAAPPLPKRTG